MTEPEPTPEQISDLLADLMTKDKLLNAAKRYVVLQLDPQLDPHDRIVVWGPFAPDVALFELERMRVGHDAAGLHDVMLALVPMEESE